MTAEQPPSILWGTPVGAAAPSLQIAPRTDRANALTDPGDSGSVPDEAHITLCDAIDRLLNKGAVVKGEITISVADVDLVYLGFHVLLASVETARQAISAPPQHPTPPTPPSPPAPPAPPPQSQLETPR